MPNLQLRFQIDFVIVFRPQTVARLRAVLAHHDDRRLHRSQTGENQIEQNEWIRIKRVRHKDNAVDGNPDDQNCAERNEKFPTPAELRDVVGKSLAESEFPFELFADVTGKDLVLLQTLDHFLVERGKLANLILQNFFDVVLAEFAQVIEADEPFGVQVGQFLLNEFEKGRSDKFRNHSAVRRLRFFANLTDQWCGYGFAH